MRAVDLPWDDPQWRAKFDRKMRQAVKQRFALWDAEREKGYGGNGMSADDVGAYDDINSHTYGGTRR